MRETGPYFKRIPPGAEPYVKIAETILGAYKRQLGLLGLTQGTITRTLQDGTVIRVARFGGNDIIEIKPPTGATADSGDDFQFICRPGADTSVEVENAIGLPYYYRQAPLTYYDEERQFLLLGQTQYRFGDPSQVGFANAYEYGAQQCLGNVQLDTRDYDVETRNISLSRWGRHGGFAGKLQHYDLRVYGGLLFYAGTAYSFGTSRIVGAGLYRRSLDNRVVIILATGGLVADGTFIGFFGTTFDTTGRAPWLGATSFLLNAGVSATEVGEITFHELYPDTGTSSVIGSYSPPGGWVPEGDMPDPGNDIQDISTENPPSWNQSHYVYQLHSCQQWFEFSPSSYRVSFRQGTARRTIQSWNSYPSGQPTMESLIRSDVYHIATDFTFTESALYSASDTGIFSVSSPAYSEAEGITVDPNLGPLSFLSDGTPVQIRCTYAGGYGNDPATTIKIINRDTSSTIAQGSFNGTFYTAIFGVWMCPNRDFLIYAVATDISHLGTGEVQLRMLVESAGVWSDVLLDTYNSSTASESEIFDFFVSYPSSVAEKDGLLLISLFGNFDCTLDVNTSPREETVSWEFSKAYNRATGQILGLPTPAKIWGVAAL